MYPPPWLVGVRACAMVVEGVGGWALPLSHREIISEGRPSFLPPLSTRRTTRPRPALSPARHKAGWGHKGVEEGGGHMEPPGAVSFKWLCGEIRLAAMPACESAAKEGREA